MISPIILAGVLLPVTNALIQFAAVAGGRGLGALLIPVPVLFVSLAVYLLLGRFVSRRSAALFAGVAIATLATLVLLVAGESFYQFIYRESFAPLEELPFVPAFLEMITGFERLNSPVAAVLVVALIAVFPALLFVGVFVTTARVAERSRTRPTSSTIAIAIVLLTAGVFGTVVEPETPSVVAWRSFQLSHAEIGESTVVTLDQRDGDWEWPHAAISLLILESYGHTLFSRGDHREAIAPTYRRLSAALQEGGIHVVSGFSRSPAFGGRSWLADGTILAGRWLGDQRRYEAILETDESNMVRYLNGRGYRSVLAAPAMTYYDEPWLAFYEFERAMIRGDFGYNGPVFDFGIFTDQYLLHVMSQEQAIAEDGRPRFLTAILVSTHVPFRVVPPYVEDWSTLGDGSIYHELGRRRFNNNWLTGGEYPEGYIASVDYTLQTVVDYVVHFAGADELVLVIGDHQPRIPISEREATFSVPFHIMSRNRELVRPFEVYGFVPGFVPTQEPPHPAMDSIYPMIREVVEGTWRHRRDVAGADYVRLR